MTDILNILTVASMLIMTLMILLQTRGASLGAGFGGSGEIFTARRGVDKTLFELTIIFAVLFVGSIVVGLLTA